MKLRKLRKLAGLPKCGCGGTPKYITVRYGYGAMCCDTCGIRTREIDCDIMGNVDLQHQNNWYKAMKK